jgi:peptide deformylase
MDLALVSPDDPVLRQVCAPVEVFDQALIDLGEAMLAALPSMSGVGLAAPQVGRSIRLFVVDVWWNQGAKEPGRAFVNPKVTPIGKGRQRMSEGCLSVPGRRRRVERARKVQVEAQDLQGQPFTLIAEGLLAVALQHENDHLDGVLFIDHRAVL